MTWSCIAVKKPSVSVNKSALVSHLFDTSMSTYCWPRSYGRQPCKAFWAHCLLTLLLYSSSVASSLFAFAWTKPSGVHLSSAFTTAAWRDDVTCLFKKYVYYYYYYYYYYLFEPFITNSLRTCSKKMKVLHTVWQTW